MHSSRPAEAIRDSVNLNRHKIIISRQKRCIKLGIPAVVQLNPIFSCYIEHSAKIAQPLIRASRSTDIRIAQITADTRFVRALQTRIRGCIEQHKCTITVASIQSRINGVVYILLQLGNKRNIVIKFIKVNASVIQKV